MQRLKLCKFLFIVTEEYYNEPNKLLIKERLIVGEYKRHYNTIRCGTLSVTPNLPVYG